RHPLPVRFGGEVEVDRPFVVKGFAHNDTVDNRGGAALRTPAIGGFEAGGDLTQPALLVEVFREGVVVELRILVIVQVDVRVAAGPVASGVERKTEGDHAVGDPTDLDAVHIGAGLVGHQVAQCSVGQHVHDLVPG